MAADAHSFDPPTAKESEQFAQRPSQPSDWASRTVGAGVNVTFDWGIGGMWSARALSHSSYRTVSWVYMPAA